MPDKRRMWIVIGIFIVVALLLGYFRPRMMMAKYHSEEISDWTAFLSRKVMKLGSSLEHYSQPDELADAMGRIRVEFRYLEMFLGHHSEQLASITGTFDARTELGSGFYGLWTTLQEGKESLLEQPPPPDLQQRRLTSAEKLFDIGQQMRDVVAEPEGQAYFGVESLSQSQIQKINELLLQAVAAVEHLTPDD